MSVRAIALTLIVAIVGTTSLSISSVLSLFSMGGIVRGAVLLAAISAIAYLTGRLLGHLSSSNLLS